MKKRLEKISLTLVLIGSLLSCSQNSQHKILSLFFDGVTAPDTLPIVVETGKDETAETVSAPSTTGYYYHAIYQQKECGTCHDAQKGNRLVQELPDLCYQCHTDFSEEYPHVHVPVAMGECRECHHPHLARQEHLLIAGIQELCFACHEENDLRQTESHSEIGETGCTDCHDPHGGEDEKMFK